MTVHFPGLLQVAKLKVWNGGEYSTLSEQFQNKISKS
jgi:hypothetical protein